MIEPTVPVNVEASASCGGAPAAPRSRTRTCVGCGERINVLDGSGADLIRLILGHGGEIAVDGRGGGFGRGAHVHARRPCLERATRSGLQRATKGNARRMLFSDAGLGNAGEGDKGEALSTDSLARAIQSSMNRRVEGLLRAAVRSRHLARGADAVIGACLRGEADLVVVACDAPTAADLTEVRRAVADGRAVAWGTSERIGAIVAARPVPGRLAPAGSSEGVGVVSIASRSIAEALRQAVRTADTVTSSAGAAVTSLEGALPKGGASAGDRRRRSRSGAGAGRARGSSQ